MSMVDVSLLQKEILLRRNLKYIDTVIVRITVIGSNYFGKLMFADVCEKHDHYYFNIDGMMFGEHEVEVLTINSKF